MKHYKLTDECLEIKGRKLYQIQALIDIPEYDVKAGDVGGYVESCNNLTENAWIATNVKVYEDAKVRGRAYISGNVAILGDTKIEDNVYISASGIIQSCYIRGSAEIRNEVKLFYSSIGGNAKLEGSCYISGANILDNAYIADSTIKGTNIFIFNKARIIHSEISSDTEISGDVLIKSYDYVANTTLENNKQFSLCRINAHTIIVLPKSIVYNSRPDIHKHKQLSHKNFKKLIKNKTIPEEVANMYKALIKNIKEK